MKFHCLLFVFHCLVILAIANVKWTNITAKYTEWTWTSKWSTRISTARASRTSWLSSSRLFSYYNNKSLKFYFRLPKSPRLSTTTRSVSTTWYAAIWSTWLFWLSATPWLSAKPSISSISTSISRFFLEFHFSKYNDIFKVIHQEHPDHIPLVVLAVQWADHQIQINRIHMERLLMVVNRYFRLLNRGIMLSQAEFLTTR